MNVLYLGFSNNLWNRIPSLIKKGIDFDVVLSENEKKRLSLYLKNPNYKIIINNDTSHNRIINALKIANFYLKSKLDYKIIMTNYYNLLAAVIIRLVKKDVKIILHIQSPYVFKKGLINKISNMYYQLNLWLAKHYADLIIVLTEGAAKDINKTIKNKQKIIVSPPGVSTDFFNPHPQIKKENIIMYHGAITKERGIENLLEAIKILRNKKVKFKFYLYGNYSVYNQNSLYKEIKSFIKNNNMEEFIKIKGDFQHYKLRKCLNEATLSICPTPNHPMHNLNVSYKVLESLAMKVPVICVDSPINRNVDPKGRYVFFVSDSPNQIARKIIRVLSYKKNIKKRLEYGRKHVKDNFSWDTNVEIIKNKIIKVEKNENI